jgi:membrane associated rhomboid family serine protease
MFFPLADDNRDLDGPAWVTWILIAINVLVFSCQSVDPGFTYGYSMIPWEITRGVDLVEPQLVEMQGQVVEIPQAPGPPIIYLTLFTSMFMHGGLMHIGGNMLYLWIFGDNVEHRFGHLWFLLFYLISGLAASFAQILVNPDGVIPNLGASGAIFGVLGAYLVLFPRNQVKVVVLYYIVSLPAMIVIGVWAVMQFFFTWGSLFATEQTGGVAYAAHAGGLVAGALMGIVARQLLKEEPDSTIHRIDDEDPRSRIMW